MNEADFDALSEHLKEVRPIFDRFCAANGFVYVPQLAIGRYPRIRIERPGAIKLWFDLWMELDASGRRFERFVRDLPYELSAGASLIVQDGSKNRIRVQKAIQCFSDRPFHKISAILLSEMQEHLHTIEAWNAEYLHKNGMKIPLRS